MILQHFNVNYVYITIIQILFLYSLELDNGDINQMTSSYDQLKLAI